VPAPPWSRGGRPQVGQTLQEARRELLAPPLVSDRSLQLGGLARSNAAPTRDGGPAITKSRVLLFEVRLRKLVDQSDRGIDAMAIKEGLQGADAGHASGVDLGCVLTVGLPRCKILRGATHPRYVGSSSVRGAPIDLTGTSIRVGQLVCRPKANIWSIARNGQLRHTIDAMSSDDFSFSAASPSQQKQEEPAAAAPAPPAPRYLLVPVDDSEVWPRDSCHGESHALRLHR